MGLSPSPRQLLKPVFVIALVIASASTALAADRVKAAKGAQSTGKVIEGSPTEVVLEVGSLKKKFPVNELESVQFDGEPNDLTQARIAVRAGRYQDAARSLAKIDTGKLDRDQTAQDVEFYKALAAARLALTGNGSKADAGKRLFAFEKAQPNSFHYFETCEVLGDLLSALGKFAEAETYYLKLAAAPWPEYKMRAGLLAGRALVGQKEFDRSLARFDEVLASDAKGKEADALKLDARLGKAAAMAGAGKTDEAVKNVEEIIAQAEPENLELHARAYNVLGNCYKSAGKKKEALLAFLHVDLLYGRFAELHAEALANLATLWAEIDKPDRAAQARSTLKEKYPTSAWASN
jgi:tetratricopeptide (TPR) repeat protein